jgi:phosphonate transport system substrate-binding protein
MAGDPVKVGAVSYDPKVVEIWEGIRDYFRDQGIPTDYVLFSNYDALVDALVDRMVDIAWSTNVAFVRAEKRLGGRCISLAMRNTDRDFTTRLIARIDSGISRPGDLRGKRLALGSADSAQAAILPLYFLRQEGIDPEHDLELIRFDLDVGKHGDTGTSELEVLRAVHQGEADAGAIGHVVWIQALEKGSVNQALVKSVWTSPPYDHCSFTALDDLDPALASRWTEALLRMDFNDPRWRRLMELEGLTAWVPGRTDQYETLREAIAQEPTASPVSP